MISNNTTLFFSDYLKEINEHLDNKMNVEQDNKSFQGKDFLCSTWSANANMSYYFLNNQPGALIIQIYSVIKLHVSGSSLPIIRSSLL
jgi:hypothetical protein